jgi:long-chain acyl-CoA synthetase
MNTAIASHTGSAAGHPQRGDRPPTSLPIIDYSTAQSLPDLWTILLQQPIVSQIVALQDPHSKPALQLTYGEVVQKIRQFAAGLQALGVQVGDRVALFADNSPRWLIADQGMMTAGAIDAVRGSQADPDELLFILSHSDSMALVAQDLALLKKLLPTVATLPIRFVILLSDETPDETIYPKILNFSQALELGATYTLTPVQATRDAAATLMYTSGTSGTPKGVILTHNNLLSQIEGCLTVVQPQPGEKVLSILPIWHCYERTFEYFILSQACTQIYTNIRHVKSDLKTYKPHYMVGVPRLWESIYEGVQRQFRDQPPRKQRLIQFFLTQSQRFVQARRLAQGLCLENLHPSFTKRLAAQAQMLVLTPLHQLGDRLVYQQVRAGTGGELKYVVSGGGSIAEYLEDFFEIVGIEVLGGYGLTETSPITHVRRPWRNLRGADGQPLPHTETQIVDPDTRNPLPTGQQGLILIRGHQVMRGYYKNPDATAQAINAEGWFNTGDLGWVTAAGDLIITGRAKDTIVLTNGENIEPQPIEDACLRSPFIDQIMLVGQDQRSLGALIVPNLEALKKWAIAQNLSIQADEPSQSQEINLSHPAIQDLFRQELNREVKNRSGYRPDDRIGPFHLISEPFTVENGMLTQTLKIRRAVVMERYRGMIDEMFT